MITAVVTSLFIEKSNIYVLLWNLKFYYLIGFTSILKEAILVASLEFTTKLTTFYNLAHYILIFETNNDFDIILI